MDKTYYHNKIAGAEVQCTVNPESPHQLVYVMVKGFLSGLMASTYLKAEDAESLGQMILEAAKFAREAEKELKEGF